MLSNFKYFENGKPEQIYNLDRGVVNVYNRNEELINTYTIVTRDHY